MQYTEADGRVVDYFDIDDPFFISAFETIAPHSITTSLGPLPAFALFKSIEYVVNNNVPGDIVECGVWNGGSMLLAAMSLMHFGDTSRTLYLYDTFEGMPEPNAELDKSWDGYSAHEQWRLSVAEKGSWGFGGSVEMVRQVMMKSGYPPEQIVFVKGMVEDTIPGVAPKHAALLRLDTDLYQSTYHELVHLYPRLVRGGVLILDDYGYFQGAKTATDQYIAENNLSLLLNRIDLSVRVAIKP